MKIRHGFISNSSSSSFIVINWDKKPKIATYIEQYKTKVLLIPNDLKNPNYEFGWDFECYYRFEDKLCWAILQAQYKEGVMRVVERANDRWPYHSVIYTALRDMFGINDLRIELDIENGKGYIDHQSVCTEDKNNAEIFMTIDNMKQFLFNRMSYVSNGNDNEDGVRSDPPPVELDETDDNAEKCKKETFEGVKNQADKMTVEKVTASREKAREISDEDIAELIDVARKHTDADWQSCLNIMYKRRDLKRQLETMNKDQLQEYILEKTWT